MTRRTPDLFGIDPAHAAEETNRRGLESLPDAELVDRAAEVIGRPKRDDGGSFVLHAPLELLARAALLARVSPGVRADARLRIVVLAATYERAGEPAPVARRADDAVATVERLAAAIGEGDLDGAGELGARLGQDLDAGRLLATVGEVITPSLAAAAHGPIFLHHLQRVAARSPAAGALLGNMARDLARNPGWQLSWMDRVPGRTGDLAAALAGTPVLGTPGSSFIFPLMDQAESSGLAAEVAGQAIGPDVDVDAATRTLLRVATASMLLDDPGSAPYGWTHCLTIPQAMASMAPHLACPHRALSVAATHVVGFRAGLGRAPLTHLDPAGGVAAGGIVVSGPPDRDALQAAVDHAAVHPDAHFAKYVVACLDAARTDGGGAPQHLAAAVHLDRWWREND
jgi:hypothetical protein